MTDKLASIMSLSLVSLNCGYMRAPYLASVHRRVTDGTLSGRKFDLLDQRRAVAHPRGVRRIVLACFMLRHKQSQNARKTAKAKYILQE